MYKNKDSCCTTAILTTIQEQFTQTTKNIIDQLDTEFNQYDTFTASYNQINWPQEISDDQDLSKLAKTLVRLATSQLRQYVRSFKIAMCKCLKQHFNRIITEECSLCDPDWSNYIGLNGSVVTVNLVVDYCDSVAPTCRPVISSRESLRREYLLAKARVVAYLTAAGFAENPDEEQREGKSSYDQIDEAFEENEELQDKIDALTKLRDDLEEAKTVGDVERILKEDVFTDDVKDFVGKEVEDAELVERIEKVFKDNKDKEKKELAELIVEEVSDFLSEEYDIDDQKKDELEEELEELLDQVDEIDEATEDIIDEINEFIDDLEKEIDDQVDDIEDKIDEQLDEAQEKVDDKIDEGKDEWDEIKNNSLGEKDQPDSVDDLKQESHDIIHDTNEYLDNFIDDPTVDDIKASSDDFFDDAREEDIRTATDNALNEPIRKTFEEFSDILKGWRNYWDEDEKYGFTDVAKELIDELRAFEDKCKISDSTRDKASEFHTRVRDDMHEFGVKFPELNEIGNRIEEFLEEECEEDQKETDEAKEESDKLADDLEAELDKIEESELDDLKEDLEKEIESQIDKAKEEIRDALNELLADLIADKSVDEVDREMDELSDAEDAYEGLDIVQRNAPSEYSDYFEALKKGIHESESRNEVISENPNEPLTPNRWHRVSTSDLVRQVENDYAYSPQTSRVLSGNIPLPDFEIEKYSSPCSGNCSNYLCDDMVKDPKLLITFEAPEKDRRRLLAGQPQYSLSYNYVEEGGVNPTVQAEESGVSTDVAISNVTNTSPTEDPDDQETGSLEDTMNDLSYNFNNEEESSHEEPKKEEDGTNEEEQQPNVTTDPVSTVSSGFDMLMSTSACVIALVFIM
eukprot:CAMPEP_0115027346 /NCGR_PEP_ID=MMETSP0216-20121206/35446_1 /TAXON_ID=223996 /ORGANISM="Protocruzia adherens, Strain Boccale" /LENGTH=859 /DNA_ID=CAMNT_0002402913 /DNA_START=190 /DNA_END=2772 /DNA_ORIENTATION=+